VTDTVTANTRWSATLRRLVAGVVTLVAGFASQSPRLAERQQYPSFKTSVDLTLLPVHVSDKDGRPISGLCDAPFRLFTNNRERPIRHCEFISALPPVAAAEGRPDSDVRDNWHAGPFGRRPADTGIGSFGTGISEAVGSGLRGRLVLCHTSVPAKRIITTVLETSKISRHFGIGDVMASSPFVVSRRQGKFASTRDRGGSTRFNCSGTRGAIADPLARLQTKTHISAFLPYTAAVLPTAAGAAAGRGRA
jgi:hypothetical protein